MRGLRNTHKMWWECKTGIAYLPGSRDVPAPNRWRTGQSMIVADGATLRHPQYVRTYGVVARSRMERAGYPTRFNGPNLHTRASQCSRMLARGRHDRRRHRQPNLPRVGCGDDGILQIVDRKKLLPPSLGGNLDRRSRQPTEADLLSAQAGILHMSPDQGGHTSMPVFGLTPASYAKFTEFKTRDIVLLSSEATSDKCQEAPALELHRRRDR